MDAAKQGEWLDKCLWTGIAGLVSGGYNSTALVGTADQVSDALLEYYRLGIDNMLIRGFDPLNDATEYGKQLIPLTREKRPQSLYCRRVSDENKDPPCDYAIGIGRATSTGSR